LTSVKKTPCVRKQFPKKFAGRQKSPTFASSNSESAVDTKDNILLIKERKGIKMKRLFMVVVAMLSMTMTFAENENAANLNNAEAYNMTVNMKKLGQALNLSKDQVESFAEIHKTFSAEMMFAAQASGEERQKMVDKAIGKDLAYMNYILSHDQYRRYVMLLNITLINRGLK
jgi:hypothetical protein